MRFLFYKHHFTWPFSSGHDVHTYNMMRALSSLGAEVGLVTMQASPVEALQGLSLGVDRVLDGATETPRAHLSLSRFQDRFRSYWGVERRRIALIGDIAADFKADAVVVSGLDVLPMLGAVKRAKRVWYAADEWWLHHASQVEMFDRASWSNVKDGLIKASYERAYRTKIDRAWVVSEQDRTAMRWVAGIKHVDVLPNGVDADRYQLANLPSTPDSAVFWGRLDFGPNIQALQWFCSRVWPAVRQRHPGATFTIIGFSPGAEVKLLARAPGIELLPDLPDVRETVARRQVVVLPFVSGGGIKNKLLEAAAMGRPIVGSRKSAQGLTGTPALRLAGSPAEWVAALSQLWRNPDKALELGREARAWVVAEHSWERVARTALERLEEPVS